MKPNSELVAKWSELVLEDGFTVIPNLLIRHMVDLGIHPLELSVIVVIEMHRWRKGTAWPTQQQIANYTGFSVRHINRITTELSERGLLKKIYREGLPCLYDFEPLVRQLEQFKGKRIPNDVGVI